MTSISPLNSVAAPGVNDPLPVREAAALARVSVGMMCLWLPKAGFKSWTILTRRGFTRGVRFIDRTSFQEILRSHREPRGKVCVTAPSREKCADINVKA